MFFCLFVAFLVLCAELAGHCTEDRVSINGEDYVISDSDRGL